MSLLKVDGMRKSYVTKRNLLGRPVDWMTAVSDVGFEVQRGETLALVGESGAGKSTTGRMILRLIEPDAGRVEFDGEDVLGASSARMRSLRRRMQMIFQDPYGSLDPRMTIGDSIGEPLLVHDRLGGAERREAAADMLDRVGLGRDQIDRYPGELSGGQLQRVAIGRALTLDPDLIVCDEPVAALDVSVRAQVLNLMRELQRELGLSYLFVSHDLALVEVIADRIAVMAQGRIVEIGPTAQVFRQPESEHTRQLLAAVPRPIPRSKVRPANLKKRLRSPSTG